MIPSPRVLGYFLNTVRYLRPVQVYGRIWFKLYRPNALPVATTDLRPTQNAWRAPARRQPSMLGPSTFCFLNESRDVDSASGWNHPDWDKLWLYHLHYFDDLNSRGADVREVWHRALVECWIRENPPPQGNGWEPYPLSLRIVNWIKWSMAGKCLDANTLHSLAVQARYLSRRLEWHLLGNHLFANAKALAFAGSFYAGSDADEWLSRGLTILRRELKNQILPDGGHFERSPMYHSIILEDLLDLINLGRAYEDAWSDPRLIEALTTAAERMRDWLDTCCHPDGQIALFNDAAFGMACAPRELHEYAYRLGLGPRVRSEHKMVHRRESGYVRLQWGSAYVLIDVGEIGPDYLPGHAHADTLSFELSLFNHRVLVNSGTSHYGAGPERLRQRSTSAHNTVIVNGQNSSEVWSGFRVARRARPFGLQLSDAGKNLQVQCAHSGYQRLKGKPIHWRRWALGERELTVHDWIEGPCEAAVAAYHFHPDVIFEQDESAPARSLVMPNGHRVLWEVHKGACTAIQTTYHPEFGVSQNNTCLLVTFTAAESKIVIRW